MRRLGASVRQERHDGQKNDEEDNGVVNAAFLGFGSLAGNAALIAKSVS
jgi:hypothetical protein